MGSYRDHVSYLDNICIFNKYLYTDCVKVLCLVLGIVFSALIDVKGKSRRQSLIHGQHIKLQLC